MKIKRIIILLLLLLILITSGCSTTNRSKLFYNTSSFIPELQYQNNSNFSKIGLDILYGSTRDLVIYTGEIPLGDDTELMADTKYPYSKNSPTISDVSYWGTIDSSFTGKIVDKDNNTGESLRLYALDKTSGGSFQFFSIFYDLTKFLAQGAKFLMELLIKLKNINFETIAQAIGLNELVKLFNRLLIRDADGNWSPYMILCIASVIFAIVLWTINYMRGGKKILRFSEIIIPVFVSIFIVAMCLFGNLVSLPDKLSTVGESLLVTGINSAAEDAVERRAREYINPRVNKNPNLDPVHTELEYLPEDGWTSSHINDVDIFLTELKADTEDISKSEVSTLNNISFLNKMIVDAQIATQFNVDSVRDLNPIETVITADDLKVITGNLNFTTKNLGYLYWFATTESAQFNNNNNYKFNGSSSDKLTRIVTVLQKAYTNANGTVKLSEAEVKRMFEGFLNPQYSTGILRMLLLVVLYIMLVFALWRVVLQVLIGKIELYASILGFPVAGPLYMVKNERLRAFSKSILFMFAFGMIRILVYSIIFEIVLYTVIYITSSSVSYVISTLLAIVILFMVLKFYRKIEEQIESLLNQVESKLGGNGVASLHKKLGGNSAVAKLRQQVGKIDTHKSDGSTSKLKSAIRTGGLLALGESGVYKRKTRKERRDELTSQSNRLSNQLKDKDTRLSQVHAEANRLTSEISEETSKSVENKILKTDKKVKSDNGNIVNSIEDVREDFNFEDENGVVDETQRDLYEEANKAQSEYDAIKMEFDKKREAFERGDFDKPDFDYKQRVSDLEHLKDRTEDLISDYDNNVRLYDLIALEDTLKKQLMNGEITQEEFNLKMQEAEIDYVDTKQLEKDLKDGIISKEEYDKIVAKENERVQNNKDFLNNYDAVQKELEDKIKDNQYKIKYEEENISNFEKEEQERIANIEEYENLSNELKTAEENKNITATNFFNYSYDKEAKNIQYQHKKEIDEIQKKERDTLKEEAKVLEKITKSNKKIQEQVKVGNPRQSEKLKIYREYKDSKDINKVGSKVLYGARVAGAAVVNKPIKTVTGKDIKTEVREKRLQKVQNQEDALNRKAEITEIKGENRKRRTIEAKKRNLNEAKILPNLGTRGLKATGRGMINTGEVLISPVTKTVQYSKQHSTEKKIRKEETKVKAVKNLNESFTLKRAVQSQIGVKEQMDIPPITSATKKSVIENPIERKPEPIFTKQTNKKRFSLEEETIRSSDTVLAEQKTLENKEEQAQKENTRPLNDSGQTLNQNMQLEDKPEKEIKPDLTDKSKLDKDGVIKPIEEQVEKSEEVKKPVIEEQTAPIKEKQELNEEPKLEEEPVLEEKSELDNKVELKEPSETIESKQEDIIPDEKPIEQTEPTKEEPKENTVEDSILETVEEKVVEAKETPIIEDIEESVLEKPVTPVEEKIEEPIIEETVETIMEEPEIIEQSSEEIKNEPIIDNDTSKIKEINPIKENPIETPIEIKPKNFTLGKTIVEETPEPIVEEMTMEQIEDLFKEGGEFYEEDMSI